MVLRSVVQRPTSTYTYDRCGGINAVPAADSVFSPGNTIAPQNIDLNVLTLNGKSRANYKFSRVNNPGKFRLCFCPGIPGSVSSVCESPPQFRLSLGTVRIQGVISDVRAGILPTNKVVTVQVESTVPGSRIKERVNPFPETCRKE